MLFRSALLAHGAAYRKKNQEEKAHSANFQRTSEKTRQLLLLQPPFPFLLLNNLSQPKKPSQDTEVPVGAEKEKSGAVVASRTEEKAKEKENGKEKIKNKADANPSEDALTIGDMVSKAKVVESKSKIDSKKDSH